MDRLAIYTTITLIIAFFVVTNGNAQNRVPNPGFDSINFCPQFVDEEIKNLASGFWYQPTGGTPDLFHRCGLPSITRVPNNLFGYQPENSSSTDSAYAGFYLYNDTGYREYISSPLNAPLTPV